VATGAEGLSGHPAGKFEAERAGIGNAVLILLIWLVGASACLLLYWGSKLSFLLDDWEFLVYRRGFNAHTILDPHGEHIAVAPILIYKALLATAGMSSALPFRVVSTVLFLLSAVLLFAYLRRRVGQWPALAGAAIVLFLGAAWEDLLWAFQIGYFGSMAAGLGMLLALERRDRLGDRLACALLAVSILFSSLGLPFAAGAAVQVLRRPDRWRRLYVVAIPLAIYAAWWLGWGHTAESSLTFTHVAQTPLYVLDGIAASLGSLFGLATPALGVPAGGLEWGRPLAVVAILAATWRIHRLGRVPDQLWVVLAVGATFWILAGFNQMPGREPTASRYQYVGAIFVLLVAAELLRGVRLEWRLAVPVAIGIAVASIASNVVYLHEAYADNYHPVSQLEKAGLGAIEIARDTVEPGFALTDELVGTGFVHVEAGPYLAARDEYGSPAYSDAEIAESSAEARFAADKVLFGALRMGLAPVEASALPGLPPTEAKPDAAGVVSIPARGCVSVTSQGTSSPLLSLPRTGVAIRAEGAPIGEVKLARYASGDFPILMTEGIAAGGTAEVAIPPDRSTVPWKMQLQTAGSATVCGRSEDDQGRR